MKWENASPFLGVYGVSHHPLDVQLKAMALHNYYQCAWFMFFFVCCEK